MNYKIKGAIKENGKKITLFLILWVLITIVFVSPFSYSIALAKSAKGFDFAIFAETLGTSITNPFGTIGNIFLHGTFNEFFSTLLIISVLFLIAFIVGCIKSAPKNEYTNIEHGSSDWSQHGEQYQVLSKNKGIVLAENNYLPVDKRGNVNVLVVGRIWIW